MKKSSNITTFLVAFALFFVLYACGGPGTNQPGDEYMPDMGHSIAYEANYYDYYKHNRWGGADEYYKMAKPRKPVKGTIPRGNAGHAVSDNPNAITIPANGSVPYYYEDTEEERLRATAEINTNPFPITSEGLARGKDLYNINCGICHGTKGDGNGWLVDENNPNQVYPAQPAILTNDEFTGASEGRLYHAIVYGKNVMGGYTDKLSYEERWQVIHHIRALQAKDRSLAYSQDKNTLNAVGVPGGPAKHAKKPAKLQIPTLAAHGHDEDHGHGGEHKAGGHGDDHGHDATHHDDASHKKMDDASHKEMKHDDGHGDDHGNKGHDHEEHDHEGHKDKDHKDDHH